MATLHEQCQFSDIQIAFAKQRNYVPEKKFLIEELAVH
jgi:hypothetical protein